MGHQHSIGHSPVDVIVLSIFRHSTAVYVKWMNEGSTFFGRLVKALEAF